MFDYHGKIEGFYGLSRGEKYIERPFGMHDFGEAKCPTELPYWAPTWWRLTALVPPKYIYTPDPYVLYDSRDNTILHVWNQEDPPCFVDVLEVCSKLLPSVASKGAAR